MLKLTFEIESKEKVTGKPFYKEVVFTSRARSTKSPILEKEFDGWVNDTVKYFNLDGWNSNGWSVIE